MARDFTKPEVLEELLKALEEATADLREAVKTARDNQQVIDQLPEGEGLLVHTKTASTVYIPKIQEWAASVKGSIKTQIGGFKRGVKTRVQYDKERHARERAEREKPERPKRPKK